jgi:phage terminase small subunit
MPALKNARHEAFCRALSKGETAERAYEQAGYLPSRHHASRLATKGNIRRRLDELKERAAIRAEISAAYLTEKVLALAKSAEDIPQNPAAIQAALASYMGAAKLNGLIIDRSINERKDTVDLTRAELMDLIRQRRGLGSGDAQSDGRGREPDRVYRMDLLPIQDRKAS